MSDIITLLRKRLSAYDSVPIATKEEVYPIDGNYEIMDFIDTSLEFLESLHPNTTLFPNHQGIHIAQMVVNLAETHGFNVGDAPRDDYYLMNFAAQELEEDAIRFLNQYFASEGCQFEYQPDMGDFGYYQIEQTHYLQVVASPEEVYNPHIEEDLKQAFQRFPMKSDICLTSMDITEKAHIMELTMVTRDTVGGYQDITHILSTIGYKNILIHTDKDE